MKYERRYFSSDDFSFRAIEEDGQRIIQGYAALYGQRSRLLFENGDLFYEELERGAFDEVVNSQGLDVIFNYNHDNNKVMARTTSGTLSLKADENGLFFRAIIDPEITEAKDLWLRIKRGDISQNSFAFYVSRDDYEFRKIEGESIPLRSIKRIKELSDVSSVTRAAYPQTTVEAREWSEVERAEEKETPKDTTNERQLLTLRIKI